MQTSHLLKSPQLLKVPELAALLRVKPRTIYEMVARKIASLIGSRHDQVFLRSDLDEIIAWTKARDNK
jgi:predicted DNA-binding transcriptional regulator AlpA